MFMGYGFTMGCEYGLYETVKQFFRRFVNKSDVELIPFWQIISSSTFIGFLVSLIYSPTEYCKIQMQLRNLTYSAYSGSFEMLFGLLMSG